MLLKILLISSIALGSLVLSGCATDPAGPERPPVVKTKFVTPDCGNPPERGKIKLRPIIWDLSGGKWVLTAKGYEDLSYNMSVLEGAIKELIAETEYYRQCVSKNPDPKQENSLSSLLSPLVAD